MFNVATIRQDFPFLQKNPGLTYFDSACMSLKPNSVIAQMTRYYEELSGCGGNRSSHRLSVAVREEVEAARAQVAKLINASAKEIVFTSGTTQSIATLAANQPQVVITSDKEHNSNLVPWIRLKKLGLINHQIVPTNANGGLDLDELQKLLSKNSSSKTKLLSLPWVCNLDGVVNPVAKVISLAHEYGFWVHLDSAQVPGHVSIDVKELDVDFLSFSGHKMLGPTGTGVLYGKKQLLELLEPLVIGGGSVLQSSLDDYTLLTSPEKFEGGLQNYAGIMGLKAATAYLENLGVENIASYVCELTTMLRKGLNGLNLPIQILAEANKDLAAGITTFIPQKKTGLEVSRQLDEKYGIICRSGEFCVNSWFSKNNLPGAVRISLSFYNTTDEVDHLLESLKGLFASL